MNGTTFTRQYEQMSDSELLRIAAERDTLVADAAAAIDAELTRRGFTVEQAKKETKRTERKRTRRQIGRLGLSFRGVGKHFFGISNYSLDPVTQVEEFDSTLWLWVLWLPIVPLASYRIRRRECRKSVFWSFRKEPFSTLNEAPPRLSHVLIGIVFSTATALVAFNILVLLVRLSRG